MPEIRPSSPRLPWPALALLLAGLLALYLGAIRTRFLADDYLFLEQARQRPLLQALGEVDPLGNYYRPLSRQVYFAVLAPLANGDPLLFHVVNALLFAGALLLLADLLRVFLPRTGVLAGVIYFALLPFQRVNLMWVSCGQDLMALAGVLGAMALHRRGRTGAALAAFAAAVASKETALALPIALLAWERAVEGRDWRAALRRVLPYGALALAWVGLALVMRMRHIATGPLDFAPETLAAGYVHLVQSLLGVDHPAGFARALATHGPALVPLALLAALAWWVPARRAPEPAATPGDRALVTFALVWLVAFTLPAGPVARIWSSYYYTPAAVGAALLVGRLFAALDRWGWVAYAGALLWWHAGGTGTPAFAVAGDRWGWTSHLTPYYFENSAALTDTMSRQLVRLVPRPEPHTRFYFATLPSWAGFQRGNGAQIRALYRDTTLASYFYSQFSDSTAGGGPARFFYWDGAALQPLGAAGRTPWFQVGGDLLLLDRPAGARDAFQRGLVAGGNRMDLLYWLGWAELMSGRRDPAEAAWREFGAVDDSLRWLAHLLGARNTLTAGDTVETRRHLVMAIQYGVGRPQAHVVLGELLLNDPRVYTQKYGLMELRAGTWLDPRDWEARRALALGLARVGLDEPAAREVTRLVAEFPAIRSDAEIARLWQHEARQTKAGVVEIGGGAR